MTGIGRAGFDDRALPDGPGAYVLAIALARPLDPAIATLGPVRLAAGLYAYCGSARGPGGIRARVGRHLRREKPLHWHVDRLTRAGRIVAVGVAPGRSECDLISEILLWPGASAPIAGFGSSDCRCCPAHLAAVPVGFAPGCLSRVRTVALRPAGG